MLTQMIAAAMVIALLLLAAAVVVDHPLVMVSRFWVWIIGSEVFIVSLILLDVSQHRCRAERTITGGRTMIDEGEQK